MVLQIGVQQIVGIQFGAVTGHQVQFDALSVFGEPGPDGFAAVDRVPVGDHVDLAAGVPGETVEERAEQCEVNLPGKTVNHSAPREAMADMTLTPKRRPFTRTSGVCPAGAQERPGGAVSDRRPH
nr:hypothetical protein [Streptomyces sp. MUM 2J]